MSPPYAYQPQTPPGVESSMQPLPVTIMDAYKGTGKFAGRVTLITGGDSGIGRAVAAHFAREGSAIAIQYLPGCEDSDAKAAEALVLKEGQRCLLIAGDLSEEHFPAAMVDKCLEEFGRLDNLILNAAQQSVLEDVEKLCPRELHKTYTVNVLSQYMTIARCIALRKEGKLVLPAGHCAIILTASVNAFKGHGNLPVYSGTKAAQMGLVRSLAPPLVQMGIRINAVAPGPIWTPLIVSTMGEHMKEFGSTTPMQRAGQPAEVAPAYVFLADETCSSYIAGQTIHVNGGVVVNA